LLKPFLYKKTVEAGCDEAGRGCLAGPVYAAAVILPPKYRNSLMNDSKQLSAKQRDRLRIEIESSAAAWAIGICSPAEIDSINILNASFLAMHRAIEKLGKVPEHLLIDGNRFRAYPGIPHSCVIKGDGKYLSIAAASILAKTHRDEYMEGLHQQHPGYNWRSNKGYPTADHRTAIAELGVTEFHRTTFRLLETQLRLDFGK
jgi:ribonuclease HII